MDVPMFRQRRLRDRADQIDVFLAVSIGRAPFEATLLKPEYFGGSRANEIGDDDEAGVAKAIEQERQAPQRPFRIRIQIRVWAWLSQHGASDMPVEPAPMMLWSELLIQIFETVAQREYLVR